MKRDFARWLKRSDAIITIDANSTIIYVNHARENLWPSGGRNARPGPDDADAGISSPFIAGFGSIYGNGKRHISWSAVELPGLHKDLEARSRSSSSLAPTAMASGTSGIAR